jgi:hypothetical protein
MWWIAYYSYLGTKMQNPTKSQSITTLVFASIFIVVLFFVFGWSIFHLIRLYRKKNPEPMNMAYAPVTAQSKNQAVAVMPQGYSVPATNMISTSSQQAPTLTLDGIRTTDPMIGQAY